MRFAARSVDMPAEGRAFMDDPGKTARIAAQNMGA
jgi:hypothetical protein